MKIEIKHLPAKPGPKGINPDQGELDLRVDKHTEIQGIGMGVLSDGTAFLNQRGLARLCGVQNRHIGTIGTEWSQATPRIASIKATLASRGVALAMPFIPAKDGGRTLYAYPDSVCLAVLEYFAFDAGANCKDEARKNFRVLAGKALQEFIYTQVGYSPTTPIPLAWRQFHDRVSLLHDSVPHGYFSVFKEIADLVVTLIRSGAMVGPEFVPDISVGQHWAKHWTDKGFEAEYGSRIKYEHNYPDYFPQAASNPQEPHCYPDSALPEFRRWMREDYLATKLRGYLSRQESKGTLPPSFSDIAMQAVEGRKTPKLVALA